jgi:MSHA biogenesis protein MshN
MSLINKVLQDLEKRRGQQKTPEQAAALNLAAASPNETKPAPNKRRRLILIIVLIIVVVLVVLLLWKPGSKVLKYQAAQPVVNIVPAATVAEVPEPAPVSVQQASVLQSTDQTLLTLALSDKADYRLHQLDESDLQINLLHTNLQGSLNDLNLKDTAITSITSQDVKGDLQLDVKMLPGTEVKSLNYEDQAKQLILILANPKSLTIKQTPVELSPAQLSEQQYQQAVKQIASGNMQAAKQSLQSALRNAPDNVSAREALATLLLKQQDYNTANAVLEEGLEQDPENLGLLQLQAYSLLSQNKAEQAVLLLQTVSPPLKSNLDYYDLMANAQRQVGDYQEAVSLYSQLLEVESNRSSWWLGLAVSYEALKQNNQAVGAYKRALATGQLSPALQNYVISKIKQLSGQ